MAIFLEKFIIPKSLHEGENLFDKDGKYIGGNYPSDLFPAKLLNEVDFKTITIFYGGNGSGKTTLLNLIAEKLNLFRLLSFNFFKNFHNHMSFYAGIKKTKSKIDLVFYEFCADFYLFFHRFF